MNNLKEKPLDWWIAVIIVIIITITAIISSLPHPLIAILIFASAFVVMACLFRIIKNKWPVTIEKGQVTWNF